MGELARRHQAVLNGQPMRVTCIVCGFVAEGPAGEARAAAAAHREEAHPRLAKPAGRREALRVRTVDRERLARVEARAAARAKETDAADDNDASGAASTTVTPQRLAEREDALAAIRAWAAEHKRVPTETDALADERLPGRTRAQSLFGSWRAAVETAGLPPELPSRPGGWPAAWDRPRAADALRRFVREQRRLPRIRDVKTNRTAAYLPSWSVLHRLYGGLGAAIETIGLEAELAAVLAELPTPQPEPPEPDVAQLTLADALRALARAHQAFAEVLLRELGDTA